jgi:hypothetical protein
VRPPTQPQLTKNGGWEIEGKSRHSTKKIQRMQRENQNLKVKMFAFDDDIVFVFSWPSYETPIPPFPPNNVNPRQRITARFFHSDYCLAVLLSVFTKPSLSRSLLSPPPGTNRTRPQNDSRSDLGQHRERETIKGAGQLSSRNTLRDALSFS